jgi:choline dehydrogenase-like flavoprotein
MAPRNPNCDVVIVGGGMAGAVLALRLASHAVRVLIVERERNFKDRVRGENLVSSGVAEARRLGIYETLLKQANVHEVPVGACRLEAHLFPSAIWWQPRPSKHPVSASINPRLLKSGCRTIKLATLMAMGPYERPKGIWVPSFAY